MSVFNGRGRTQDHLIWMRLIQRGILIL